MAIIAALLVVAAVTTIAAALMQRQTGYVRAVQTAQTRAALQAALFGGLKRAQQRLRDDGLHDARTVPGGLWAKPIADTRLAMVIHGQRQGPVVTGRLEDEQGKFNLSNLVSDGMISEDGVLQLRTLCSLVEVDPNVADNIARRLLASWPVTSMADTSASGSAATPPMASQAHAPSPRNLDDLRGVQGLDDDAIARLRPHVTLLPSVTLININTATAEVMAATLPAIGLDRARTLAAQRDGGQWFLNERDFFNRLNMPEISRNDVRVTIQSDWFLYTAAARLAQAIMPMHALLARDGQNIYTVWYREGS